MWLFFTVKLYSPICFPPLPCPSFPSPLLFFLLFSFPLPSPSLLSSSLPPLLTLYSSSLSFSSSPHIAPPLFFLSFFKPIPSFHFHSSPPYLKYLAEIQIHNKKWELILVVEENNIPEDWKEESGTAFLCFKTVIIRTRRIS